MFQMIFVLFVRLGQKRFITYFMNALFQISFGNILKISGIHSQYEDFTLKDVLVGRLDEECDLLNYLFILAKLHIWTCRKHSVTPNFRVFIGMVDVKYRTEMYIAEKNNRRGKFQAKWQLYISARELVG